MASLSLSRISIALQNGEFDIQTLVLIVRAYCEHCLEESFPLIMFPVRMNLHSDPLLVISLSHQTEV
jgi:hypothetical protein